MFQLKLQEKSRNVSANQHTGVSATEQNLVGLLLRPPVSFWLDSSGGPSQLCNLSMVGSDPKYVFYGYLNEVYEKRTGEPANRRIGENCFDFLEEKINKEKSNKDGVFVGYFSYDLFQKSAQRSAVSNQQFKDYPDFFFAYFESASRYCKTFEEGRSNLITLGDCFVAQSFQKKSWASCNDTLVSNMTDNEYLDKVNQIKEEIKKGNVYQVNLTREYSMDIAECGMQNVELELYLRLREISPNPYGCFFKTPFLTILSSSPEEFLYIEPAVGRNSDGAKRTIRTRPIKGTLPKNVFDIDPKNQAENIMIVDLERNDLGRICEYGSVTAKKLLEIEKYKHLNHVVSTVEGKLRPEAGLRQIFEALFPGGSITGAPKTAAMKIIDKIEPTKRGAYTGSFGYIKTNGEMNFNILIRTIFMTRGLSLLRQLFELPRNDTFCVTFNVGGGIVADSDPQAELDEIKLKAKGIITSLGLRGI